MEKLAPLALWGSRSVLWLLALLSVASIAIMVERLVWFARRRADADALAHALLEKLSRGDVDGALQELRGGRSVESQVLAEALVWYEAGPEALAQALQASVRAHRKRINDGMVFLGTLGNNAPFVGLLGTVLGVVTAFGELGANAVGAMGNVMTGIGEALVATAVGILVALPAVASYNLLQKRSLDIEENVARLGHVALAVLERRRSRRVEGER
ncbi:MAG: MotA/TolQ/ExbB proton channel family protein [Deltaproteobacteria bacterium]|nr:MotA/TolQ/ExbB proton channel family protein [Deltaproteobacteria bacterium]